MRTLTPPYVSADRASSVLRAEGFAVVDPAALGQLSDATPEELAALVPAWERLPRDEHLRDGGRYRRRRHGSFIVAGETLEAVPHRAHWQPEQYNALHGGIERWFEPLEPEFVAQPAWQKLVVGLARLFAEAQPTDRWFVEAHPFRIGTDDGIGRPTPEGAHRDGVDFVALLLVGVRGIKGGETRVFQADSSHGQRFTMAEPWSALLIDDRRVIHESTPIQPLADAGHRDTLVLTFRSDGFQAPRNG